MKYARNPLAFSILAVLVLLAPIALTGNANAAAQEQAGEGPRRMGGYEVVENWPKPLPDGPDGVKHDGWTWGSGCGVWAESPDKVWICQRGEIELPPGAKPWTFAGLLTPPRTNTGRWPYS